MREGEGGDLQEERFPRAAEQEDAEDEENVVQPLWNDVGKALLKEAEEGAETASGVAGSGDAAFLGAVGDGAGEGGEVEGEAGFSGEEDCEAGVNVAVDDVLEDDGQFIFGGGSNFPAGESGGDAGFPATGEDDDVFFALEFFAGFTGELELEVGMDASNGVEVELDEAVGEFFGFGAQLGFPFFGEGGVDAVDEGGGGEGVGFEAAGVDLYGDDGFASGQEVSAHGDVRDGVCEEGRRGRQQKKGQKLAKKGEPLHLQKETAEFLLIQPRFPVQSFHALVCSGAIKPQNKINHEEVPQHHHGPRD